MTKTKKNIVVILLIIACIFCSAFLSGCVQFITTATLNVNGFVIDKIIYTDNKDKYLSDKTLMTGELPGALGAAFKFAECQEYGIYVCDNKDGTVDIVFDTSVLWSSKTLDTHSAFSAINSLNCFSLYESLLACNWDPISYASISDMNYYYVNDFSHLFSANGYLYEFDHSYGVCDTPGCDCGVSITYQSDTVNPYGYCGCVYLYYYGGSAEYGKTLDGTYHNMEPNNSSKYIATNLDKGIDLNGGKINLSDIHSCCYDVVTTTENVTDTVTANKYKKTITYKNTSGDDVTVYEAYEYEYVSFNSSYPVNEDGLGYNPGEPYNPTSTYTPDAVNTVIKTEVITDNTSSMEGLDISTRSESRVSEGSAEIEWTRDAEVYTITSKCSGSVVPLFCNESLKKSQYFGRQSDLFYHCSGLLPYFNELIIDGFDMTELSEYIEDGIAMIDEYSADGFVEQFADLNDYSHMFDGLPCKKISIRNIKNIKHEIKDLSYMFANCVNLDTVEFGDFLDGVKPTDVSYMFYNCPNLRYVDLSGLDTSNVTNMTNMFGMDKSRDDIINYVLKHYSYSIEVFDETGHVDSNGNPWTWDSLFDYLKTDPEIAEFYESNPEACEMYIKTSILIEAGVSSKYNPIPLTYDELIVMLSSGDIYTEADFLIAINTDASSYTWFGFEVGKTYTLETMEAVWDNYFLSTAGSKDNDLSYIYLTRAEYIDDYALYLAGLKVFESDDAELNFLFEKSGVARALLADYVGSATNAGEPWTLAGLKQLMIDEYSSYLGDDIDLISDDAIRYMAKLQLCQIYPFPIRFTEAEILAGYNLDLMQHFESLDDLVIYVNANLSDFGLTAKEDGTNYSKGELMAQLNKNYGVALDYFDATLYDVEVSSESLTRDQVVESYINSSGFMAWIESNVGITVPADNDGEPWTLDSIALWLVTADFSSNPFTESYAEDPTKTLAVAKNVILYYAIAYAYENGLEMFPVTYVEALSLDLFMGKGELITTMEEAVEYYNANSTDGTVYTEESVKADVEENFESVLTYVDSVDDWTKEIRKYIYTPKDNVENVLILGGDSSLFKITSDMDTLGMLADCYFDKIVLCDIEEGVELSLNNGYNLNGVNYSTITSRESNKTLNKGVLTFPSEGQAPSSDNNSSKAGLSKWVIVGICCGSFLLVALVVILLVVYSEKKRKNITK